MQRLSIQKKNFKKIEEIEESIEVYCQLGCGCIPSGAHDRMCEEIDRLQEELAHLRHYGSTQEMFGDMRGTSLDIELPW